MELGNSFALSFESEAAKKIVEQILKKKHWRAFKEQGISLSFTPYYTFYYDTFTEEQTEKGKKISGTKRGRLALNAVTAEIDTEVSQEIEKTEIKKEKPKIEFTIEKEKMNAQEAEKITPIKTTAFLQTHDRQIIITQMQLVHYPVWTAKIETAEGKFEIKISGTNGRIIEEKIPERKKGLGEIAGETFYELRKPSAWGKYSIETGKTILGGGFLKKIFKNRWLLIAILLLIIILIVFFWP